MKTLIALLPGDGIGPEVLEVAAGLLSSIAPRLGLKIKFKEALVGGSAIDRTGVPMPPETYGLAQEAKAVLLGAVGGPAWDDIEIGKRPEKALLALRKGLGLFANLRPVRSYKTLLSSSPLKEELIEGIDLLIVRELTGGIYFGEPRGFNEKNGSRFGFNTMVYDEEEVRRIARVAFHAAMSRRRLITSVDKANVLEASRLWRQTVEEEARHFPDIILNHLYVDNCAMQLILKPSQFDVLLSSNLFGDILSDEAAVLVGSIGMLPSASLGNGRALYEPIHGSAPDIAGQDKANPVAAILSISMMLRHTFHQEKGAAAIERAVEKVLEKGYGTPDIWREGLTPVGTARMGQLVLEETCNNLSEEEK